MSGWNGDGEGHSSGSDERAPSEEQGQAAWGAVPPWASAETQTSAAPPPWASAETRASRTPPPWASAETGTAQTPPPWAAVPPPPAPSPYVPPPSPPSSPPAVRRLLVIVAVTAVLGAGTGAGVWFLTREGATGPVAAPGTGVAATTSRPPASPLESPSRNPSPGPSLSPEPSEPAAGYRRVRDPVGYTLVVPAGWVRRQTQGEKAPVVFYDDPDGGRQLQIFLVTEDDPASSLRKAETDPGYGFAHQPGYQVLARDEGATWSELAYRYDDEDKGPRQVVDHRFRAPGGDSYAIRSSGPGALPVALVREPLAMALDSFCPTGADCG
ncbi:hypothetical protein ACIPSE_03345 [Streptomyces sp. NPDC090106]|uniref:hypothetical protein n=1 Tax=Streptomyces sp. NPDC090106 TaxID=3365946 RepID=UPI00382ED015